MSEKLYRFLLKLYPEHFRRTYGAEALRLVRDRARSEQGFLPGLRLWLDLLLDLAISLPRENGRAPIRPIVAAQIASGERSFELLTEASLNPALLCFGATLSALLFWLCVFVVAHSGGFPALFPAPLVPPRQEQSAPDQVQNPAELEFPIRGSSVQSLSAGVHSLCIAATQEIPGNSPHPLLAFRFTSPASGVALIDGIAVKRFSHEQRLSIRAHLFAGNHRVVLYLNRPAANTTVSGNDDFESCQQE